MLTTGIVDMRDIYRSALHHEEQRLDRLIILTWCAVWSHSCSVPKMLIAWRRQWAHSCEQSQRANGKILGTLDRATSYPFPLRRMASSARGSSWRISRVERDRDRAISGILEYGRPSTQAGWLTEKHGKCFGGLGAFGGWSDGRALMKRMKPDEKDWWRWWGRWGSKKTVRIHRRWWGWKMNHVLANPRPIFAREFGTDVCMPRRENVSGRSIHVVMAVSGHMEEKLIGEMG